jgi:hypothetical protein
MCMCEQVCDTCMCVDYMHMDLHVCVCIAICRIVCAHICAYTRVSCMYTCVYMCMCICRLCEYTLTPLIFKGLASSERLELNK